MCGSASFGDIQDYKPSIRAPDPVSMALAVIFPVISYSICSPSAIYDVSLQDNTGSVCYLTEPVGPLYLPFSFPFNFLRFSIARH